MRGVTLKYLPPVVSTYKTYLRLRSRRVRDYLFVASTGRCGTESLMRILAVLDDTVALHEPYPPMRNTCPPDQTRAGYFHHRFDIMKSIYVRRAAMRHRHYVETNHQFIKSFADDAAEEFGDKLKVIHLRRAPVSTALSFYRLDSIPGRSLRGNLWLLDPADPENLIPLSDLLAPGGRLDHDFYRCLWYCYEVEARVRLFRVRHPELTMVELQTKDLNDLGKLMAMFGELGIDADADKVRGVVGTKVNGRDLERGRVMERAEAEKMDETVRSIVLERGWEWH